jgi:hypothetical protein
MNPPSKAKTQRADEEQARGGEGKRKGKKVRREKKEN